MIEVEIVGVRIELPSNQPLVLLKEIHTAPIISSWLWYRVGSRDETPATNGISHVLEHMAFKGTKNRTAFQIASQIENVGGEINAATSVETTSFYARVLADDVPLAQQFMQRIIGLRAGRVVFDGPPEQLTESVLTTIYGAEDWTAMRKDGEADRVAEAEAVARLAMISA